MPKIRTRKGDRLLVTDKHGVIIHTATLGKGTVQVSKARK